MELSGGTSKLRALVRKLDPELQFLQNKVYPAVQKMEETERRWEALKRSHSLDQLRAMKKVGYTQLDPDQFELLYGSGGKHRSHSMRATVRVFRPFGHIC